MAKIDVDMQIEDDRMDALPFRLVCLDMDGTMLNDAHQISTRTANTLNMLSSTGVMICIATGRSHNSVIDYLAAALTLSQDFVPVICFNGSVCVLVDIKTWKITKTVFTESIPKDHIGDLISLCSDRNGGDGDDDDDTAVLQYYDGVTGDVNVAENVSKSAKEKELLLKYSNLTGKKQVIVPSYKTLIDKNILPVKCLVLTTNIDYMLNKAYNTLKPNSFHIIRGSPFPFFVEFLKPNVNKGTAIERLIKYLNDSNEISETETAVVAGEIKLNSKCIFSLETTIAFGDGENDAEMLSIVGHGVAMINGRPAAKDAANDITIDNNENNGVAKYLESVFFV